MFKITDANNYLDDLWRYAFMNNQENPQDYMPSEYERRNDLSYQGTAIPGGMVRLSTPYSRGEDYWSKQQAGVHTQAQQEQLSRMLKQYKPNSLDKITGPDNTKSSNPKDAVGISKVPMSTVPAQVIAEIGLGMLEGSLKYGRHNYRIAGVRASVYYDAALRHLIAWWEGQDIDPDSGLSHITKAMASLTVLRDAMINDKLNDDRPPPQLDQNWVARLNEKAKELIAKYPNPKPAFTKDSK